MTVRLEHGQFTQFRPRWACPSGAMTDRLGARDAGRVVHVSWPVIAPPGRARRRRIRLLKKYVAVELNDRG